MGDLANDKASAEKGGTDKVSQMADHVEITLKQALAVEDRALGGVSPVISHLLASTGHSLVSDEIVARLRGMMADLSDQIVSASFKQSGAGMQSLSDRFADQLSGESALLSHCYALAMEGHLTDLIARRSRIDPVLTPLAQELVASDEPAIAEMAMGFLAAQARFLQHQLRMQMPLLELPAELFHSVLRRWENFCEREEVTPPISAIQELKNAFDESSGRVGLLARLVSSMRGGAVAALDLDHSGLALFVSALSSLTRQPRELAVLACHERQVARLVLSLRAAGLDGHAIERQMLVLQPHERAPAGIGEISPRSAQNLLLRSDASSAG